MVKLAKEQKKPSFFQGKKDTILIWIIAGIAIAALVLSLLANVDPIFNSLRVKDDVNADRINALEITNELTTDTDENVQNQTSQATFEMKDGNVKLRNIEFSASGIGLKDNE